MKKIILEIPMITQFKFSKFKHCFTHLNKSEKAQRALLKHFMMDKDVFLNYNRQLEANDFTNKYFQSIFKG